MDNVLSYLIQLKANKGNVASVATQTVNDLNRIDRAANKVQLSMKNAFSMKNLGNALSSVPGMAFLMNPYTAIAAGVGVISKLGAEAEMTSVAFSKLVGDETKAASVLKEIKDYSNATPYESMDLIESAKQMMSFGVSTEKTVDTLKRLGDISMGDKNKLSSLSLVYAQVASAGKLQGQDFLQFVNAGFNPLQELSQMTGKTMGELKDMMSKGQIGAEAVSAAIAHATNEGGKFFGMSEQLAGTTSGKFSTFLGKAKEMATSLFTVLQPIVNVIIDIGMALVDNLSTGISEAVSFVKELWNTFGGLITVLGKVLGALGKFVMFMQKGVMSAIQGLLLGVGNLGKALLALFNGNFSEAWDYAKKGAGQIWNGYTPTGGGGGSSSKITNPGQSGSIDTSNIFSSPTGGKGGKGGKGAKSKTAEGIATGGTRNTQITVNLGKFFDNMNVTMADKTDTAELQTIVVQSLNRALAIATSTDR